MIRHPALRNLLLVAAAALGVGATTTPAGSLIDRARIDSTLQGFIDRQALVGTSALIYERDREVYFGAFGMADREAAKPMKRDTIVQIFSMTKPVTGVALLTLYDQGRFQLDDPVAKYVPEFANLRVYAGLDAAGAAIYESPRRPITIRDLMRHTAGFLSDPDDTPVGVQFRDADPMNWNNTLTQMAERLARVPLAYQPGTRWFYSRSVDVQAFLVERLSGERYDQYLRKHIFGPLGMKDTGFLIPESERPRLATMYERAKDGTFTRGADIEYALNSKEWPLKPGGYGLVSTIDDYMRFARMLLNEGELDGVRVLEPATVRLMATDAMPAGVTDKSWLPGKGQVGFGIDVAVRIAPPAGPDEASGAVGEFFWDGLANTLFWVGPKNKITAVLFTQYKPFGGILLHKGFRDAVYAADPVAHAH